MHSLVNLEGISLLKYSFVTRAGLCSQEVCTYVSGRLGVEVGLAVAGAWVKY